MADQNSRVSEMESDLRLALLTALELFKTASFHLLDQLAFEHYADKPHADKVANNARHLLATFALDFFECHMATDELAKKLHELMTLHVKNSEQDPDAAVRLTEEMVQHYTKKPLNHIKCFDGFWNKLSDFSLAVKKETQIEKQQIVEVMKSQRHLLYGLDFLNCIEGLQAPDLKTAILALIINPGIKFAKLIGSRAYQAKIIEKQELVKSKWEDIKEVENIGKRVDIAQRASFACKQQWLNVSRDIQEVLFNTDSMVRMTVADTNTFEGWESIFSTLTTTQTIFQEVGDQVYNVIREIQEKYGRTMPQLIGVFNSAIEHLSPSIAQLFTTVAIIHGRPHDIILEQLGKLAECLLHHLRDLQAVFEEWISDVASNSTGHIDPTLVIRISRLQRNLEHLRHTDGFCKEVRVAFEKGFGALRSSKAKKEGKEEKRYGLTPAHKLPLATFEQVARLIDKVEHAISTSFQFSIELSMALLLYAGGNPLRPVQVLNLTQQDCAQLPLHPLKVDIEIIENASNLLAGQISELEKVVKKSCGLGEGGG